MRSVHYIQHLVRVRSNPITYSGVSWHPHQTPLYVIGSHFTLTKCYIWWLKHMSVFRGVLEGSFWPVERHLFDFGSIWGSILVPFWYLGASKIKSFGGTGPRRSPRNLLEWILRGFGIDLVLTWKGFWEVLGRFIEYFEDKLFTKVKVVRVAASAISRAVQTGHRAYVRHASYTHA